MEYGSGEAKLNRAEGQLQCLAEAAKMIICLSKEKKKGRGQKT